MEEAATIEELMFAMIERADRVALATANATAISAPPETLFRRTRREHNRSDQFAHAFAPADRTLHI